MKLGKMSLGQTMVVHPLDAKDLQKKQNKKLQDRSFPQNEEPVEPNLDPKKAPKQKQPKIINTDVKVKKQPEYKPW
jgi:hypothetical protein